MIYLENINKSINNNQILKNINLHIEKGEFVAIVGQSGSGKTSLLNILGTLDVADSGKYIFEDYEITKLNTDEKARLRCEKIGFIFQRYNLLSLLNAKENVALPAIYKGEDAENRNLKAINLLKDLELGLKIDFKPNELSGGQQQRISIARALINNTELILADEPTGALDSKSGIMVLEILQKLHKKGHTIILITHDKEIAKQANRIIEIKDGQIIKDSKNFQKQNLQTINMPAENINFKIIKTMFLENLKMAYSSIISHKLRSILTMLGIIIGISSVICVVALGLGSQEKILSSISRLGTNTLEIRSGKGFGDLRSGISYLNLSDLKALRSLPYLQAVEAQSNSSGVLTYKNISLSAIGYGVGVNEFEIKGVELEAGRILNEKDVIDNANVVVLGHNARQNLFKDLKTNDILNKVVIFNNQPFKIIGILKKQNYRFFEDTSVKIYIPYTTMMSKITGTKILREIIAKVKDGINPKLAEEAVVNLLVLRREKKDFYIINSDTIKQAIEENEKTTTILTACIAIIALIVGGIGVMNIMLVSVSERTKEIGIRMAIGAKRRDILMQFLTEAIMICTIGAFLGLLLSFIIIFAFNNLSKDFYMIMSLNAILLGIFSSILISVIFGFFPAKNAANLNPISALSKE